MVNHVPYIIFDLQYLYIMLIYFLLSRYESDGSKLEIYKCVLQIVLA